MTEPSMFEALNDPQMRHAALVHSPIVFSMISVVTTLVAGLLAWKFSVLRWLALLVAVIFLASAVVAERSGEDAEGALGAITSEASAVLEEHEGKAQKAWLFAAATGVLVLVSVGKPKYLRHGAIWASFAVAAGGAFWMADTAHHGGLLVYSHGLGAPEPPAVADTTPPPDTGSTPDEVDPAEPGDDGEVTVDPRATFFVAEIFPILEANCFKCHNDTRQKADLDQTSLATLLKGGESGPALVPGDADASLMFQRMTTEDEDDLMPPDERLSDEAVAAVRAWIEDGAVWVDSED